MTDHLIEFGICLLVMIVWAAVLGFAGVLVLRFANWIAGLIHRD